jgi:retron-type reverse transcriptase
VQGGSISPLLANIYLHYVMDLWMQQWRVTGVLAIIHFSMLPLALVNAIAFRTS